MLKALFVAMLAAPVCALVGFMWYSAGWKVTAVVCGGTLLLAMWLAAATAVGAIAFNRD